MHVVPVGLHVHIAAIIPYPARFRGIFFYYIITIFQYRSSHFLNEYAHLKTRV